MPATKLDADIPVVQLSMRADLDPASHILAGEALASLRDDNVLIIGSVMSFHSMAGYGDKQFTVLETRLAAFRFG